jgi:hypothetical protein
MNHNGLARKTVAALRQGGRHADFAGMHILLNGLGSIAHLMSSWMDCVAEIKGPAGVIGCLAVKVCLQSELPAVLRAMRATGYIRVWLRDNPANRFEVFVWSRGAGGNWEHTRHALTLADLEHFAFIDADSDAARAFPSTDK